MNPRPDDVRTPQPRRPVAAAIAWLAVLPSAGAALAGLLARWSWLCDSVTAFVPYAAAAAAGSLAVAAVCRRWVAATLAALLLGWLGGRAVAEWGGGPRADAAADLTVMSANVKTANRDFERFTESIRRDPPDVLAVLETDVGWATALDSLADLYPHRRGHPQDDNFGLTLLSRRPWSSVRLFRLGEDSVPAIEGTFAEGTFGRPLTVFAVHPTSPGHAWSWQRRNEDLVFLADRAAATGGPLVVMGDINAAPWSPHYAGLLRRGGLTDGRRRGRGWSFTWNAYHWWLRTPIDSVFTRGAVEAIRYSTGPANGSDHFPVRAELRFVTR